MASVCLDADPRRSYPRLVVDTPARFGHGRFAREPARLRDVSPVGAFLEYAPTGELVPGQSIRLKIPLKGERLPLEVTAEIMWTGFSPDHVCAGFGVEFDAVALDIYRRLVELPNDGGSARP